MQALPKRHEMCRTPLSVQDAHQSAAGKVIIEKPFAFRVPQLCHAPFTFRIVSIFTFDPNLGSALLRTLGKVRRMHAVPSRAERSSLNIEMNL